MSTAGILVLAGTSLVRNVTQQINYRIICSCNLRTFFFSFGRWKFGVRKICGFFVVVEVLIWVSF